MSSCGLWVMDVQQKLTPCIHDYQKCLQAIQFSIECATLLQIPLLVTEQNPDKLGASEKALNLPEGTFCFSKTTFSGAHNSHILSFLEKSNVSQWWICGIETHICVLLTAIEMLELGYGVGVIGDAVSARDLERHQMGLQELKGRGIPVSHSESWAYGLIKDSTRPEFKKMLELVKKRMALS
jgi:hypothetical protein